MLIYRVQRLNQYGTTFSRTFSDPRSWDVCPGDQEWKSCGSPCDQSCEEPEPMMCALMCVQKCECPRDRPIWREGMCIARTDCPGKTRIKANTHLPYSKARLLETAGLRLREA